MQKDTLTGDLLQGIVEVNTDLSVDLTSDLESKEKMIVTTLLQVEILIHSLILKQ